MADAAEDIREAHARIKARAAKARDFDLFTFADFEDMSAETDLMLDQPKKDQITVNAIGLAEEAGEVLGWVKKVLGYHKGVYSPETKHKMVKELSQTMWYVARLAAALDVDMKTLANMVIEMNMDRKQRGVIKGFGDDR